MSNIILYHRKGSPPCANVLLVAKVLGLELNIEILASGEHLKPDFLKINPQHTFPTINDNGFYLWESRAIMIYLADKYGKNDSLYPKDLQKRAVVNQRLYFDMGTLYQRFFDYLYPQIFDKLPVNQGLLQKLNESFDFLNTFLDGQTYVTGDDLTLADLALVVTIATIKAARIDIDKYLNIKKWFEKCKEVIPAWNIVDEHVKEVEVFLNRRQYIVK